MRNEFDANLSLQPLERAPARPVKRPPAPRRSTWRDVLSAIVTVVTFAAIGVMLGLGA